MDYSSDFKVLDPWLTPLMTVHVFKYKYRENVHRNLPYTGVAENDFTLC